MHLSSDEGDPAESGWLARLQHRSLLIDIVLTAMGTVVLLTMAMVEGLPEWVKWINAGALLLSVWMSISEMDHRGRFCSRCVAEWPIDGEARAQRRMTHLRRHHLRMQMNMRTFLIGFTIYIGASILLDRASLPALSTLVSATLWGLICWVTVLEYIHRPLVQWCPWCRRGNGGRERTPTPTPEIPKKLDA